MHSVPDEMEHLRWAETHHPENRYIEVGSDVVKEFQNAGKAIQLQSTAMPSLSCSNLGSPGVQQRCYIGCLL
jgi:hypothetical protein